MLLWGKKNRKIIYQKENVHCFSGEVSFPLDDIPQKSICINEEGNSYFFSLSLAM